MRRAVVIVFAAGLAAALAAPVAAVSHAQAPAERTVSCATAQDALQLSAFAKNAAAGGAAADVSTGSPSTPTVLVGVDTRYKNYVLSRSCRKATARVSLTHRGLTSAGVVHSGDYNSPAVYCSATRHVLVHFKLGFDSSGKPVSATIAIRTQPKPGRKSKEIGYVQWTPQQSVTYYLSRACTSQ